jgi:MFS family permease
MIFTVWRATALFVFFLKDEKQIYTENKKDPSLISVIQDKTFLLFFVAWLMFCLVDRFETPIQEYYFRDSYEIIGSLGPLVGSIAALVGGIFIDRVGRKKILIVTFVAMGVSYAISGFIPTNEIVQGLSLINFTSLSILSFSGGVMWVLFILVLWGDLTKFVKSEKYFAIGIMPFFVTNILRVFAEKIILDVVLTSVFSLAAFFLFIAVVPLLYAPETLPEKKIELRRLKSFADEAKRIREKYENKNLA